MVVTGAGRGIGRAHAIALAAHGARVVVNDAGVEADGSRPSTAPADDVVAEVRRAGGEAVASHDDVVSGARTIVATALDAFGRLDAVVNNAGILRSGLLLRTTPADWRAVFEVHLVGTLAVTQAAAEHWRGEAKAGRSPDACVVNTASTAGLFGFVGEPAYSAAKAGIVGFTMTAAAELERYGVRVNAIAPVAATRLTAWAGDQADHGARAGRAARRVAVRPGVGRRHGPCVRGGRRRGQPARGLAPGRCDSSRCRHIASAARRDGPRGAVATCRPGAGHGAGASQAAP